MHIKTQSGGEHLFYDKNLRGASANTYDWQKFLQALTNSGAVSSMETADGDTLYRVNRSTPWPSPQQPAFDNRDEPEEEDRETAAALELVRALQHAGMLSERENINGQIYYVLNSPKSNTRQKELLEELSYCLSALHRLSNLDSESNACFKGLEVNTQLEALACLEKVKNILIVGAKEVLRRIEEVAD